jgi:AcrR family transcriptional regulator
MSPRTPEQLESIRSKSRKRILDASFQLMAENGYESTTIAEIARKANISKGLVYNYFESKESILRSLVEGAFQEGDQLMGEIMQGNARQSLRNLLNWFFRELRERPDFWKLISSLSLKVDRFEFIQTILTTKMNEYVRFLTGLLTEIGIEHPEEEARVIAALMDGIGFQYVIVKKAYPLDTMEHYLIDKYCKK